MSNGTINVQVYTNKSVGIDTKQGGSTVQVNTGDEIIHRMLQAEIDTKQNLGYIKLDKYLIATEHGKITDNTDLKLLREYYINKVAIGNNIYYLTLSNDSILVYFCTSSLVILNQITLTRGTGQFQVTAVGSGTSDHSRLENLDFISSGHIGFAGIEFGTAAYWNERATYVPPEGMIVVYTDYSINKSGQEVPGIKIGDGNAYLINKPFLGEGLADILAAHLLDNTRHITEEERQRWNNKLNFTAPAAGSDLLTFNRN